MIIFPMFGTRMLEKSSLDFQSQLCYASSLMGLHFLPRGSAQMERQPTNARNIRVQRNRRVLPHLVEEVFRLETSR
jgi:hypothetical protein